MRRVTPPGLLYNSDGEGLSFSISLEFENRIKTVLNLCIGEQRIKIIPQHYREWRVGEVGRLGGSVTAMRNNSPPKIGS